MSGLSASDSLKGIKSVVDEVEQQPIFLLTKGADTFLKHFKNINYFAFYCEHSFPECFGNNKIDN